MTTVRAPKKRPYLHEAEVVKAVADHFRAQGCTARPIQETRMQGIDVEIQCGSQRLLIEAKGGGAERGTSKGPGGRFTNNQVKQHVAVATHQALIWAAAGLQAGVALPDDEQHKKRIADVRGALRPLGIRVFFVSMTGNVIEDP